MPNTKKQIHKIYKFLFLIFLSNFVLISGLFSEENKDFTLEKNMSENNERTILAGGCFWGMQQIYRSIPGVIKTRVGYSGGTLDNPSYNLITGGKTGHAESVEIIFDPKVITFREILSYFFRMHDPTTLNRQGNDIGTQYRSAIFYTSEEQKEVALKVKEEVDKSKKWPKPIVTEITQAKEFFEAEDYHQDYLVKNPRGYSCHFLRD